MSYPEPRIQALMIQIAFFGICNEFVRHEQNIRKMQGKYDPHLLVSIQSQTLRSHPPAGNLQICLDIS